MAIKEVRCFAIVCDVCGKPLGSEDDFGGEMHFETVNEAMDNAGYRDWHTTATSAVCFTEGDAAHDEAARTNHAAAEPGHRCWLTGAEAEQADAETGGGR